MSNEIIKIGNYSLKVKEYKGKRVVTFKDIDTAHERPSGTARKRFNDNKERFVQGEDYYVLTQPSEIRTLGFERPQGGTPDKVTLVTESGYLMLVKSFTDDLAWSVQRELVNCYFRVKEQKQSSASKLSTLQVLDVMVQALHEIDEEQKRQAVKLEDLEAKVDWVSDDVDEIMERFDESYYAISGYAAKIGVHVGHGKAVGLGKRASKISDMRGYEIRTIHDKRYGSINTYHVDVLAEAFRDLVPRVRKDRQG